MDGLDLADRALSVAESRLSAHARIGEHAGGRQSELEALRRVRHTGMRDHIAVHAVVGGDDN